LAPEASGLKPLLIVLVLEDKSDTRRYEGGYFSENGLKILA
jgi:hypothetical protein